MLVNGHVEVKAVIDEVGIDILSILISKTSIWVHPETLQKLGQSNFNNYGEEDYLWRRNSRRRKPSETNCKGLTKKGYQFANNKGLYLDDNTLANGSIKSATGNIVEKNTYEVCHIYKGSCYDENRHTDLRNLVLIPKTIGSLTDFDDSIMNLLKFRSFELYGYNPDGNISKPFNYDNLTWNQPIDYSLNIQKSIDKRRFHSQMN